MDVYELINWAPTRMGHVFRSNNSFEKSLIGVVKGLSAIAEERKCDKAKGYHRQMTHVKTVYLVHILKSIGGSLAILNKRLDSDTVLICEVAGQARVSVDILLVPVCGFLYRSDRVPVFCEIAREPKADHCP